MSDFKKFKAALSAQLVDMSKADMFRADVDKDTLWETYLGSFPEGTNPIFRERTEHDCQCCKQFIRAGGGAVSIVDGELVSVWDIEIGGHYQVVVDALSKLVKSQGVRDIFLHAEKDLGTDFNHQLLDDGTSMKWDHFHFELPQKFVKRGADIGTILSNARAGKEVFKRSLDEISTEAVETVLEMIEQNSIYRGEEHKEIVELFLKCKQEYIEVETKHEDNYCWVKSLALGGAARIRNTVIGTLLVDISDGKELDVAVSAFETKVAPSNYKRPTAVITKGMIAKAQEKVEELGIGDSLQRRHAVAEDITINNVLFADRSVKPAMNVFDEMTEEVSEDISKMKKVEEVDVTTFVETILPKADTVDVLMENRHSNNLMSLIAPIHAAAKRIFKWTNNFSWAYNGELADSIKERVKKAGGNVEGVLRTSLSWGNYDDLDIHVLEPNGEHIYYSNKTSRVSGARLDVDMNVHANDSRNAVENIIWTDESRMDEGVYRIYVKNYTPRETTNVGFDVEIEFGGTIHTFHYDKKVVGDVGVATFEYSKEHGIKFISSIPSTQASKEVWSLATQKFHKVKMIMNSPNHWDGESTGNKHLFFILEGCKNDKAARGFFNEFLNNDLTEHRKVFEVLGSKMKTEVSESQLSGMGFSSTQRNHVFCRVTGSFTRTIKINF